MALTSSRSFNAEAQRRCEASLASEITEIYDLGRPEVEVSLLKAAEKNDSVRVLDSSTRRNVPRFDYGSIRD